MRYVMQLFIAVLCHLDDVIDSFFRNLLQNLQRGGNHVLSQRFLDSLPQEDAVQVK